MVDIKSNSIFKYGSKNLRKIIPLLVYFEDPLIAIAYEGQCISSSSRKLTSSDANVVWKTLPLTIHYVQHPRITKEEYKGRSKLLRFRRLLLTYMVEFIWFGDNSMPIRNHQSIHHCLKTTIHVPQINCISTQKFWFIVLPTNTQTFEQTLNVKFVMPKKEWLNETKRQLKPWEKWLSRNKFWFTVNYII